MYFRVQDRAEFWWFLCTKFIHVNELIKIVADCEYSLPIGRLKLGSLTFADDMTLPTLFPTFLQLLMDKAFRYSRKWHFDYNETKSGVVTFGEHGLHYLLQKNNRSWKQGVEDVGESNLYHFDLETTLDASEKHSYSVE